MSTDYNLNNQASGISSHCPDITYQQSDQLSLDQLFNQVSPESWLTPRIYARITSLSATQIQTSQTVAAIFCKLQQLSPVSSVQMLTNSAGKINSCLIPKKFQKSEKYFFTTTRSLRSLENAESTEKENYTNRDSKDNILSSASSVFSSERRERVVI